MHVKETIGGGPIWPQGILCSSISRTDPRQGVKVGVLGSPTGDNQLPGTNPSHLADSATLSLCSYISFVVPKGWFLRCERYIGLSLGRFPGVAIIWRFVLCTWQWVMFLDVSLVSLQGSPHQKSETK